MEESKVVQLQNDLTGRVIGFAIDVHRELGPGLLESVYESCLFYELQNAGIQVARQLTLPVNYKGLQIDQGFRLDLLVEDQLIVEIKACDRVLPIHKAQLITYLKMAKRPLGLLMNFNEKMMKDGIERVIRKEFITS